MNANESCYGLFILFSEVSETEMRDTRVGSDLKHCLKVQLTGHGSFCVQFYSFTQGSTEKEN